MKTALTVLLVMVALMGAPVYAQEHPSSRMANAIDKLSENIDRSIGNMNQMQPPDPEAEALALVVDAGNYMSLQLTNLSILANVHGLMVNDVDRRIARTYLELSLKTSIRIAERTTANTNRVLSRLKSPAVISEVQQFRNKTQELTELLQRWKL